VKRCRSWERADLRSQPPAWGDHGVTMTSRRDTGPSARTEAAKWPRRALPPARVGETGVNSHNSAKTQENPRSQTREGKNRCQNNVSPFPPRSEALETLLEDRTLAKPESQTREENLTPKTILPWGVSRLTRLRPGCQRARVVCHTTRRISVKSDLRNHHAIVKLWFTL
jgi:hypothetical protein